MSTTSELAAYERAAEVGQRAGRRRQEAHRRPCHVPDDMAGTVIREVEVGAAGEQCLPPRKRDIEVTDEWLRRHHGLVATVNLPWLVLHAPEGNPLYIEYRRDPARHRVTFMRVGPREAI